MAQDIPHSKRRQFFIVSELNNKVLDIKGANAAAGTDIVMFQMKHPPTKNQLWYLDESGCIRSALNDMVFHNPAGGQTLQMQLPSPDVRSQWRLNGTAIVNGTGEALDIKGASKSDGANLIAYENKNNTNQRWRFQREFQIISEMNNKLVDIKKAENTVGASVITYHKKTPPTANQLWYFDTDGFIRSALNDMVFFSAAKGNESKMQPVTADPRTQWKFDGNKVVNGLKECLDIRKANDSDGAELCAYDYKKGKNQHWRYEYV